MKKLLLILIIAVFTLQPAPAQSEYREKINLGVGVAWTGALLVTTSMHAGREWKSNAVGHVGATLVGVGLLSIAFMDHPQQRPKPLAGFKVTPVGLVYKF